MSTSTSAKSSTDAADAFASTREALEVLTRALIARAWVIGGVGALVGMLLGRGPRFGVSALIGTGFAAVNLLLMARNARRAAACPSSAAEGLRKAFASSLFLRYGAFLLILATLGTLYPLDVIGLAAGLLSAPVAALTLKVRRWKKSANTH